VAHRLRCNSTARAQRLDAALVRPGRIDMQVLLGRASRRMITDMYTLA
jgi:ATP-dependent 26S proteasome regulatory subunit